MVRAEQLEINKSKKPKNNLKKINTSKQKHIADLSIMNSNPWILTQPSDMEIMSQLTVFEHFATNMPPQAALEVLATRQSLPAPEASSWAPEGPRGGFLLHKTESSATSSQAGGGRAGFSPENPNPTCEEEAFSSEEGWFKRDANYLPW